MGEGATVYNGGKESRFDIQEIPWGIFQYSQQRPAQNW